MHRRRQRRRISRRSCDGPDKSASAGTKGARCEPPMKTNRQHAIQIALASAALLFNLSAPQRTQAASFTTNAALTTARYHHTATSLPDGKVLIVGGFNWDDGVLTSAELYDPRGAWTAAGNLKVEREFHTATLLPDGKVLVTGGHNGGEGGTASISSAELYDPATKTWSETAGMMEKKRHYHTATLLQNGKVLIVGGDCIDSSVHHAPNTITNAELYDPNTGKFTPTSGMAVGREYHTATLLRNGKVLIAGGIHYNSKDGSQMALSSAELYDPATGNWTATGAMITERESHTATLLPNGNVLVAGGHNVKSSYLYSAELYDLATGKWTSTGAMTTERQGHTATLLPNGKVLVTGGWNNPTAISQSELYDPVIGKWAPTAPMNTPRDAHTASLLTDGKVLIVGGEDGDKSALSSSELFDLQSGK
jgi:N-acetylneuraminic acid mutarotase